MTQFDKIADTDPLVETPKEEVKAEEKKVLPEPRFKNNKRLWNEAMRFADMLTYCRPHQSKTERKFIENYIWPTKVTFDKKGNLYKRIGNSPVLWSSHVDTVHAKKGMQKIEYWVDSSNGDTFLGVAKDSNSSCLGGDDTTGVWIMLEMIKAKVPGLYVFHRGEECGGIGSRWIARECKEALNGIKYAIAFDRRDTGSIITYQSGTRSCSDDFAKSLADQLGMGHKCDETGMWTDTASYVDLVAECTNISTGYFNAHSGNEKVNMDYLFKLRDAICKVDVTKLVEKRKPGENTRKSYGYTSGDCWSEESYWGRYHNYNHDYSGKKSNVVRPRYQSWRSYFTASELDEEFGEGKWYPWFEWDMEVKFWRPIPGVKIPTKEPKKDSGVTKGWKGQSDMFNGSASDLGKMVKMIRNNPFIIADLLESQGYGPLEVKDHIDKCGGYIDEASENIPY